MSAAVVVGGTGGLGRVVAQRLVARGEDVVVTSRSADRAAAAAAEIGGGTRGIALDLAEPSTVADALADVGPIAHLVVTAIDQTPNSLERFDVAAATTAVTVKLVGYTEVVRTLRDRFTDDASVVLFGGLAGRRPYPGSTMVTAFNGGVASLVRTLAVEIAPYRVNAVHPGIVGDSPKWRESKLDAVVGRTPIGRLVTMDEVAGAVEFLLDNGGVNAVNLDVNGGTLVV